MLRSRIIPCLLIHKNGLVKTINFKDPKYVGDPINAVKIFNEKKVDEIMVLDIDASVQGNEPNYELISKLANECRMPLCYGGGVINASQAQDIVSVGFEKVSISNAALENIDIIEDIASNVGSQSVVLCLDVRRSNSSYTIYSHRGKKEWNLNFVDFCIDLNLFRFCKLFNFDD